MAGRYPHFVPPSCFSTTFSEDRMVDIERHVEAHAETHVQKRCLKECWKDMLERSPSINYRLRRLHVKKGKAHILMPFSTQTRIRKKLISQHTQV
jgi:hypothetical protein